MIEQNRNDEFNEVLAARKEAECKAFERLAIIRVEKFTAKSMADLEQLEAAEAKATVEWLTANHALQVKGGKTIKDLSDELFKSGKTVIQQIKEQVASATDNNYERQAFEGMITDGGLYPSAAARNGEGYKLIQPDSWWHGWRKAMEWIEFNVLMNSEEGKEELARFKTASSILDEHKTVQ